MWVFKEPVLGHGDISTECSILFTPYSDYCTVQIWGAQFFAVTAAGKLQMPVGLKPLLRSSRPDYASLSWFKESKNYSNTCNVAENDTWMDPVLSIHPCCWFIVSRIPGCGTSAGLALVVSSLIKFRFNLRFRSQSYFKYTKFQSSALWN